MIQPFEVQQSIGCHIMETHKVNWLSHHCVTHLRKASWECVLDLHLESPSSKWKCYSS